MASTFILLLVLSSLQVVFSISCECSNCDKCQGNTCIDLIEEPGTHHHWMSLTSKDNAGVERGSDGAKWTCSCSGCNGLVGTWNCPGFYDSNIIITSQTQDVTTPEFTNSCNGQTCASEICRRESPYIIVMTKGIRPDSNHCQNNYGTTLATVRTAEDKQALKDAYADVGLTPGVDHVWIGLNDRARQGDFEWWDGTPCSDPGQGWTQAVTNKCIDYWNNNEPNGNTGGEDCTHVWWTGGVLLANDRPCNVNDAYYTACNAGTYQPLNNPIDCVVSAWGGWDPCTEPCGGGSETRTRTVVTEPENGGAECDALSETQACNLEPCPINCVVSGWSGWSTCSEPCGDGLETRTRTIDTQPQHGGDVCPALSEEQHCNVKPCPINCEVSAFSEWSTCTKLVCGSGTETRTRSINIHPEHDGTVCPALSETQDCNTEECCAGGINTFNWDTMIQENVKVPEIEDFIFGVRESDLTLNIYVELPYLGKTSANNQREAKFGTTYVIDFEDFNAHSDAINEPGTCQNRMSSSFTGKDFNDFWTYSLEPQNTNGIGNLNTLSYPPSNGWQMYMKNDGCDTIVYERSFTWQELRDCSGFRGTPFTSVVHEDDKYKLSGTFYINVVSPFWYGTDFGFYRVYQLLSKPFIITISSTVHVLGSTGIDLITMWIIAVYKENQEEDFRLVLMTETAEYLTLKRGAPDYNEIFNFKKADSNTNDIDKNIFEVKNTPEAGCLDNRKYICTQLWNINAINPGCTTGENGIGTDFSGTYELGFTPECIDENDAHCKQWIEDHKDIKNNFLIETPLVWKDNICERELFELQFLADMLFYIDDAFIDDTDIATVYNIDGTDRNSYLYQAGVDRIYVEIVTDFPDDTFEIFNTVLTNVWICTFPPNIIPKTFEEVIDKTNNIGEDDMGCFNPGKDSSLSNIVNDIYPIPTNDIVEFQMHTEVETNIIRFSFKIPQEVTRDTLYIHAQIEVELSDLTPRRRILLDVNTANQISHFGNQVGVTNNKKPQPQPPINEPQLPINNPNPIIPNPSSTVYLSLKSPLVIIIGSILALILTFNICFMGYVNCYKNKRRGKGYEKIKRIDSEFDIDSEAQMLDNQE